jgi:16S rRNA G966 N2-methylase RsmD
MFDLFGDPEHSGTEQILRAYEYQDKWVNRMMLGDSLVVMNSLVEYEGMRGQVQMIYMDPPYGVKFGSNFQPFVRKGMFPMTMIRLQRECSCVTEAPPPRVALLNHHPKRFHCRGDSE